MMRSRAAGMLASIMIGGLIASAPALAESGYRPIRPTMLDKTITLTGHDLTIEQLVDVARNGAKVQLSAEAKQRQTDNYGLLLEAAAEGIAVYWFNRGAGDQRETIMFSGDPLTPKNKEYLEKSQLQEFRLGAIGGYGPEVDEEEIVRAMMVVRANAMTFNAPSPQLSQMLVDLLNRRITPVVQSRGTLGEGDLAQLGNVGATMVGAGDAYYQGTRMPAAEALAKAGLQPIQPFAADVNALTSSDAYATGIAGLAVNDAERALEWADLIYAMDLNGMNSSITPLTTLVQRERPFKWLNWDAARVRDMIKGSYLFSDDPHRIIQDPESLRASSIRQASAWEDWGALRDAVVLQMNSSDHNPAVRTDLSPQDSWDLSTPQLMKYYVKGGKNSNGKHGYIVSNANWDPYPMANKLEDFIIALANMDIAVSLRIDRFFNPFFTSANPAQVLHIPRQRFCHLYGRRRRIHAGGFDAGDSEPDQPGRAFGSSDRRHGRGSAGANPHQSLSGPASREHDLRSARARSPDGDLVAGCAQSTRSIEKFRRRAHGGVDGVSQDRAAAAGVGRGADAIAIDDRRGVPQEHARRDVLSGQRADASFVGKSLGGGGGKKGGGGGGGGGGEGGGRGRGTLRETGDRVDFASFVFSPSFWVLTNLVGSAW